MKTRFELFRCAFRNAIAPLQSLVVRCLGFEILIRIRVAFLISILLVRRGLHDAVYIHARDVYLVWFNLADLDDMLCLNKW